MIKLSQHISYGPTLFLEESTVLKIFETQLKPIWKVEAVNKNVGRNERTT